MILLRRRLCKTRLLQAVQNLCIFLLATIKCQKVCHAATINTDTTDDTILQVLEMIHYWQVQRQHQYLRQNHLQDCYSVRDNSGQQQQQRQIEQEISRPFVTLTFAQSLDGKIAPYCNSTTISNAAAFQSEHATASNYPISQSESLKLTHALRSTHDGILVGSRTLLIDNPRLTNRLWKSTVLDSDSTTKSTKSTFADSASSSAFITKAIKDKQPRPIVLDTNLVSIRKLAGKCRAKNLIVCCSEEAALAYANDVLNNEESTLPSCLELLPCKLNKDDGMLDLVDVLHKLRTLYKIKSLMVEGGAAVLSSFFLHQHALVDCVCLTFAPKVIGPGIAPTYAGILDLTADARFLVLGDDCCLLSKWTTKAITTTSTTTRI